MPTNTTTSAPTRKHIKDVALCACEKSHQIPIKNPAISRSSFRLQVLRSVRQVCSKCQKKKKPRIKQSAPSMFLSAAMPVFIAPPHWSKTPSQLRIVFDPENGDRDDHIGASLHQPDQRFFGIRFRKDDKHHDRMTKNFDPPLESHKRKIRPGDGNETVEQKNDEPPVVANNF